MDQEIPTIDERVTSRRAIAAEQPAGLRLVIDVTKASPVHGAALGLIADRLPRSSSRLLEPRAGVGGRAARVR